MNYSSYRIKKISLKNKIFHQVPNHAIQRGSIERHYIYSKILKHQRILDIYLPPSYHLNPHKSYPVIYMHDGNNLFYPEIAFAGVPWNVHLTLDRLIAHHLISECIVVGLYNSIGRNNEYTWYPMRFSHRLEGGGGHDYAHFIIQEVIPYLQSRYRIFNHPQQVGVMGSSLGGLISLYLGLYFPHIFGHIGAVSPSLWWGQGRILKDIQGIKNHLKIWLCMGTQEGGTRRVRDNPNIYQVRRLKQALYHQGFVEGLNLAYLEDRGGHHNEWHWGQRFHLPLMFFFGRRKGLIWTAD